MQPKSLFNIVLDFISKNAVNIQSLNGFPEIVGKQIFNRFVNFSDTAIIPSKNQVTVISCFATAYSELILESAALHGSLIVLNEFFDSFIILFKFVTELCLCSCYLGDSHELFDHMQNFCQLNKLCLKRNALKDRAIQRITLPIRMFNKGPKNLKYLDLSGNMFTDAIVPWLSAFQELECLDLSGSYLSIKSQKDLESCCSLKLCKSESNIHPVITNGWASSLLKKWDSTCQIRRERRDIKKQNVYYSRKRYLMATESLWGFCHKDKLESAKLVFKRAKKSPIDNNKVVDAPKINPPNEKSYQEAIKEDIFAQYSSTS